MRGMHSYATQEHDAGHHPDGKREAGDRHQRNDEELGRDSDQVRPVICVETG